METTEKINMPMTGICSFAKYPICTNMDELDADIAVLGAPYDLGAAWLSGTKFGPRRIREMSTYYARGPLGMYDPYADEQLLEAPLRIVDCGDADILHAEVEYSFSSIENNVRKILSKKALPVILGGDHSITIPCGRALEELKEDDICIIQFDAHLDWTNHVGPLYLGNGSPMRRMSEMKHIGKMVQIGQRGYGSSKRTDWDDARAYGSTIIPAREVHKIGAEGVLEKIPKAKKYYITFDIDCYDISLVSGTGTPSPGGLYYDEVMDMLTGICKKCDIVGFDMVEVAPQYDTNMVTTRIAAMTIMHFLAQVTKWKKIREKEEE